MVGTIGGGTSLPSQRTCLEILGLAGPGKAQALAEVCTGLCLAGELSIAGAICAGDFGRAHQVLARRRAQGQDGSLEVKPGMSRQPHLKACRVGLSSRPSDPHGDHSP
jgi:hydroxymethylglutaryl-CoA reductase